MRKMSENPENAGEAPLLSQKVSTLLDGVNNWGQLLFRHWETQKEIKSRVRNSGICMNASLALSKVSLR